MAFNKIKHLESAQKYLSQNKLAQAINEYKQILKVEPKDQVTLMTLGDLHVRNGDIPSALEYFEQLAVAFLGDGFNSKAIAIYKKIAKLAPEETRAQEKLAELYVAQGVMSEARTLYLQLAETHLRTGRTEQAVGVLRQLLDLEPDNLRVQLRLAELYISIGQRSEAAHAYLNCAHRMLDQGHFSEALKFADQGLKADPGNIRARSVKARALAATGNVPEAIALLESAPDASAGADTTQLLVGFYIQAQKPDRAVELARKVFAAAPDRFSVVYEVAVHLLDGGAPERSLELVSEIREPMHAAADYDRLTQVLNNLVERLPGRLEPLEWLVDAYRRSSDSFRLNDGLDQLAEALVTGGQLERAQAIFEELVEREPEDENNRRRLDQVRARLGLPALEPAPAPRAQAEAPSAELLESVISGAPPEAGQLDDETQRFVMQSLTDVDLFSSYGLTQKAVDLLENVLRRAPQHTTVLEKLLDLYLGAGNDRRTAELAAQLEQIYTARGDAGRAERFAELDRRFQRAARLTAEEASPESPAAAEFTIPTASAEAVPEVGVEAVAEPGARPQGEAAVHEVDLSEEWAALSQMTGEPAVEPPPPPPAEQAPAEEITLSLEEAPAASAETVEAAAVPAPAAEEAAEVYDYELQAAPPPAPEPVAAKPPAQMTSKQLLSDLVAEVDDLEFGPVAPQEAAAPVARAAARAPGSGESVDQLKEVFNDFRQQLGEMGAEEEVEDLETHYNLGIAYREMGLLEEAIGEFQRVGKAVQSGQTFRYAMQCYTLLGLSFMDKGQPNVAAMWYERALQTPGLDPESVLALRYDLGIAQELAGSTQAALDSFTQVYAMNIDYRDIAERIAALQKRR